MDPKDEKITAKEDAIEAILDEWGFIKGSPARDHKKAQIKEWLSNFLSSEIDDAFFILSKIQRKDDNMIRDAIALLAKEIIAIFKNDLSRVKFFPLGKSPSSSGGMYLYDFRKELSLSEDNFPYSEFKDNLVGTQALVFFDDMIGSGNQAIKFTDKNLKKLSVKLYYVSIFAFADGLEKVRKQAYFEKVFCGHLLTNEEQAFNDKTQVFTNPKEMERLKSLCEKYGKQLFPAHPLGYDDSQALLVFPHNTPNNTLPIIWASTENEKAPGVPWYPVFERKKKEIALQKKKDRPWNIPYEKNPWFTGRDNIITELANALSKDSVGALTQAISGLGGIGKTQIAVEYAYRYGDKYKAVFWVRADTTLNLSSGFLAMAKMLELPEKDARDSNEAVSAVKRWLEGNSGWLLILDNADTPDLVKDFRPLNPQGHIILTSRAQVFQKLGISKPIEINEMSPKEALEFLFKRTGRKESDGAEKEAAAKLAKELGYLPLALEQAAAYMTGKQVRFQDYYTSYLKRRLELLAQSGPVAGKYSASVNTTWAMNFSEVEKESKAAAELLRVSSFLAPDSIPLELIKDGGSQLGSSLSAAIGQAKDDILPINEILEPLTRYSLIRRDIDTHTYSIHRIVQEVLKDGMDSDMQKLWAERAVRAVDQAFPEVEFSNWSLCDRLLPHGMATKALIEEYDFEFGPAPRILSQVGNYLYQRAKFAEAEPLLRRSLIIVEKVLGREHPVVATSLNNLAQLYHGQGKYDNAEPLYQRSLAIREKALGPEHPAVATSLNNLAGLYYNQGRYAEAEPLYKRSLAIMEKALGPEHPDVARSLNNLALLYHSQGNDAEAEPLYKRSLAIREKALGPEHPAVATSLNNLAALYDSQGRYAEAEPLYKKSLAIWEKALGPEHPDVARSLNNLAELYRVQGRYAEAEPLYRRSLAIWEKALGPKHPDVALSLENYAVLLRKINRVAEAVKMEARAKRIRAKQTRKA